MHIYVEIHTDIYTDLYIYNLYICICICMYVYAIPLYLPINISIYIHIYRYILYVSFEYIHVYIEWVQGCRKGEIDSEKTIFLQVSTVVVSRKFLYLCVYNFLTSSMTSHSAVTLCIMVTYQLRPRDYIPYYTS